MNFDYFNCAVYLPGLLSVLGQHLEYLSHAMKVLDQSGNSQYGIRGQSRIDKVSICNKSTRMTSIRARLCGCVE
jgi:hypothetical protein